MPFAQFVENTLFILFHRVRVSFSRVWRELLQRASSADFQNAYATFFSTSAIKRGKEEEEGFFFTRICIESQLCAIRFCDWRAISFQIKSKMEKRRDSRTSIFEIRREKKWRRGKKDPQKPQPATNRNTYRRGISATRSGKWRIIKLVTMTTRWSRKWMTTWVAGQPN